MQTHTKLKERAREKIDGFLSTQICDDSDTTSTYGAPTTIVLPSFDIATDDPNREPWPVSGADITLVLSDSRWNFQNRKKRREKKGSAV